MYDRQRLLNSLIRLDRPLSDILADLSNLSWDSHEKHVLFLVDNALFIIERYLRGDLHALEVESWANAIEGRDGIEFSTQDEELLMEFIFKMSNQEITLRLDRNVAELWRARLLAALPATSLAPRQNILEHDARNCATPKMARPTSKTLPHDPAPSPNLLDNPARNCVTPKMEIPSSPDHDKIPPEDGPTNIETPVS